MDKLYAVEPLTEPEAIATLEVLRDAKIPSAVGKILVGQAQGKLENAQIVEAAKVETDEESEPEAEAPADVVE